MQFKFGEFPDDHGFLFSVRPLVDWSFKLISWLGITATFEIAAKLTGSPYLWTIYVIAHLLVLLFLYSFIDWLWQIKLPRQAPKKLPAVATTSSRAKRWIHKGRILVVVVLSVVVWGSLMGVMQIVVDQTVSAIVEFQKKGVR
jgi:hypothetical protein